MAKTKLSISLIKENKSLNEIIQSGIPTIDLGGGYVLYYKQSEAKDPKWVNSFFDDTIKDSTPLKSKSTSAVILYNINVADGIKRIFAITFGYGKSLLISSAVEKRFGLLVTLNSVDAEKLRSVDINSLEAIPINNRIQSSVLAGIGNFNIDIDRDLLKSVSGKSNVNLLSGTLSGADSLSVSTDCLYNDMNEFLKKCYTLYKSNHYLDVGFDWINQMQYVKDSLLVNSLDLELIRRLNEDVPQGVWISIPEIFDYNSLETFGLKSDLRYDDLNMNVLKEEYVKDFSVKNVKSRSIICYNSEGSIVRKWSVYRCLYVDLQYEGRQYLLNDGKWYNVDYDFVDKVNKYYKEAHLSDLPLIDYAWKDEEMYNKKVCESDKDRYCLMDRKNLVYGGSKIEFCDIYTKQRQFVHVKKYSGSSVLSHLFFQGMVSAENFFDDEYRKKANEKLGDAFKVPTDKPISASDYEIIYAIAKDDVDNGGLPDIPFFSKVAFRNVASRLKKFGYKVSIRGVKRTYNC